MSAKPCKEPTCGKLVVFGKDKETGKWQVLSNQAPIWRVVAYENGVAIVERDHKALLSHFVNCTQPSQFSKAKQQDLPIPEQHFSEPKDIPWSATE